MVLDGLYRFLLRSHSDLHIKCVVNAAMDFCTLIFDNLGNYFSGFQVLYGPSTYKTIRFPVSFPTDWIHIAMTYEHSTGKSPYMHLYKIIHWHLRNTSSEILTARNQRLREGNVFTLFVSQRGRGGRYHMVSGPFHGLSSFLGVYPT